MSWEPSPSPNPVPSTDDVLALGESDEIQGNILAGFNKDHQIFLFLAFPDAEKGRAWLGDVAPRVSTTREVATFNKQFSEALRNRGGDDPENLVAKWINVGLTANGLRKLAPGRAAELDGFPAFSQGPASRAAELRDKDLSDPAHWILGQVGQEVDAVVTVAADEVDDPRVEIDKERARASVHGLGVVFEQRGDTLPGHRKGHEHFGFKDGISQPGVVGFHEAEPGGPGEPIQRKGHPGTEMIQPGEFVLGLPRQGAGGAADPPRESPPWMVNGSFQVFRRLAQDVPAWWAQVTVRHGELPEDDPMTEDRLAAKLVGRWRSGTPLATAPERDNRSARDRRDDNDFDFADDEGGHKTPRFAHVRKMYPRDERFQDGRHRIIRRGIPFGRTFDPAAGRGHGVDADRGLIFNVFMASIEEQFEFLQRSWANAPEFPGVVFGDGRTDGPDPIVGEDDAPVQLRRPNQPDQALDFRRFVHTTGAVYAFAPSLSTLRRLANGEL